MMRSRTPSTKSGRRAGEPQRAETAKTAKHDEAECKRQPRHARFGAIVGKQGRGRENNDGDESEAPDADDRGALSQRQR